VERSAVKSLIQSAGLLFLAYVIVFFAWESSKLVNWSGSGVIDTKLEPVDEVSWIFADVDSSEFSGPFLPADGDTVIAINDSLRTFDQIADFISAEIRPGTEVQYTYRRFARDRIATLTAQNVSTGRALPFIILQVLRLLIILSFIGVGLWAFQKRSESVGVRVLTLFCYSMAAFPLTMFGVFSADLASFQIPWQESITKLMRVLMVFTGGLWLNLHLVFPRTSRLLLRLRQWGYVVIYSPQIIIGIWALATWSNVVQENPRVMVVIILSQFWLGTILLNRHHKNSRSLLERRQTKLVLRGSLVGVSALTFLLVAATFLQDWFSSQPLTLQLALTNLGFLALLLTPLSLAYAFGRYRLLEVEGKLRRGTRHLVTTAVLLLVFFFAVYMIGQFLVTQLGITSRTPILILAMTLALGVSPAQRWLQEWLERRFYPERYQLRVMIDDLASRMGSFPDRDTLFKHLAERLREALGVEQVVGVLRGEDGTFRTHSGRETPFGEDSDLFVQLGRGGRPVLMDEAMASLRVPFTDGQLMWIRKEEINLVLPMFARLRLIGFLGLGKPTRGHDYTPEGVDILLSLTNQVALASENLRLLEDNLEKRRLEEQLNLARQIQQGFLPQSLPETPGLDVAARSRFCLEVAGDYYDVIVLDDDRTLLAVGDVSGKGAGAALIMANLQASLRIAAKMGLEPREIVAQINNLIYTNTPNEQYITFFMGIFNPKSSTLTYVNAGHNPPLVFDGNGRTRELEVGGLIVGVIEHAVYEQEEMKLNPGERILLYTDGVTEASSIDGEEFGVVRMKQYLNAISKRTPQDVLVSLESEVLRFHGRKMLEDDSTLLMAQVN
jgi:serine phosphatase RsbU (regulator of sigma subunit)